MSKEKRMLGNYEIIQSTGERARWERYDVLGEIKPECMPDWAKETLAKIKQQEKAPKKKDYER